MFNPFQGGFGPKNQNGNPMELIAIVNPTLNTRSNISIPEGGTVEPISVAIMIDGSTLPASSMIVTPAAVDEYFNVSRAINAEIWNGCCETVAVRNTSSQPIQVQNANIIFSRPDLAVTY